MDAQLKNIWFYLSALLSTIVIFLAVFITAYLVGSSYGFRGFSGLGIIVIGYGLLYAAIDIILISVFFFIDKFFKTKNILTFIYLLISRGFIMLKFISEDNIVLLTIVVLTLVGNFILLILNLKQNKKVI